MTVHMSLKSVYSQSCSQNKCGVEIW